jgi:hypothetical protein
MFRKRTVLVSVLAMFALSVLYRVFINPPANPEVRTKLALIDRKLEEKGYRRWYFVSSGRRSAWYNDLLGTVNNSYHLKGKAVDIIVLDIDADWIFNGSDISILEGVNSEVEKEHPELVGAFGTYRKEGGIYSNMVHLDTRGRRVRYDQ